MIEILDCAFPSVNQWNLAINGMRNAFKSTDKSDSEVIGHTFIFGKKDRNLLNNLISEGDPSHRKVLRQLPVILKINAPLYWWRQMDKYQIGTVTNSESQMHTLLKNKFQPNDFSFENLSEQNNADDLNSLEEMATPLINHLNRLRDIYLEEPDKEKKKKIWDKILRLVPQSFNQARTWSGNYENLRNIYHQRERHPLQEWEDFRKWIEDNVPYAEDLIVRKV